MKFALEPTSYMKISMWFGAMQIAFDVHAIPGREFAPAGE
jgi:hypothetical protein